MVNRSARHEAKQITRGADPTPETSSKIALYGLLARTLLATDLEAIRLPAVKNFKHLEDALQASLTRVTLASYALADNDTKNRIDELFLARNPAATAFKSKKFYSSDPGEYTRHRIWQGSGSAARNHAVTLRTIAAQAHKLRAPITEEGLVASKRVPFVLSLVHYHDQITNRRDYDTWSRFFGGDGGSIYQAASVHYNPAEGLSMPLLPSSDDGTYKAAHGEQIGCPVSLIGPFVYRTHAIASQAAVESGLIELA